jgi:hypothetical protein
MNTMNMPRFTAEASAYRTRNNYRSAAGGRFLSDGCTTVAPQGCGWPEGIACGTYIGAGTAACTLACFGGPAACAACWLGFGTTLLYPLCKDCIPEWMKDLIHAFESGGGGGGGGGNRECCEFNDDGTCAIFKPPHGQCP